MGLITSMCYYVRYVVNPMFSLDPRITFIKEKQQFT